MMRSYIRSQVPVAHNCEVVEAASFLCETVLFFGIAAANPTSVEIIFAYAIDPDNEDQAVEQNSSHLQSIVFIISLQSISGIQIIGLFGTCWEIQQQLMKRETDTLLDRQKDIPKKPVSNTPEMANKIHSDQPPLHQTHTRNEEEIYQPKVMRNSSSHYDNLIEQLYSSPPQIAKSYASKPKPREQRCEINYLPHPQNEKEIIAICVVLKESQSGIISHERLLLVDSLNRTVKYYSTIPKLPLKALEDIGESPKEIIELTQVKKFHITLGKRGIGELQCSWVDREGQFKEWRIRTASSSMARELATLIEEVRTGKHSQEICKSREEQRRRQKSSLKNSSVSPNSKYLQLSSFSTNARKSEISSGSKNTQFANMLLKSMVQPSNQIETYEIKDIKMIKDKRVEQVEVLKEQQKKIKPSVLPVYSIGPIENVQELCKQVKEPQQKKTNMQLVPQPEQSQFVVFSKDKQGESNTSLNIQHIIKDASIQRIEYINKINKNNIKISHLLQSSKEKRIQQQKEKESKPLSKLQRIVRNNNQIDDHSNKSSQISIGMSKIMVSPVSWSPQVATPLGKDSSLKKIVKNNQPTNLHHIRQNLLGERKQGNQSRQIKAITIFNQHRHPRQESPRSDSTRLDHYISRIVYSKDWLLKWVTAKSQLEKADIYVKFIQRSKEKVKKLTEGFENWHLFHRAGERYAFREDEIELTYSMMGGKGIEDNLIDKMQNLKLIWSSVNKFYLQEGNESLCVPLACLIHYKGLTFLCKAGLELSGLSYNSISDISPYAQLIHKFELSSKLQLNNPSLYEISINSKRIIFIDQADLRFWLMESPKLLVNQQYIDNFVEGVIRNQRHIELIKEHVVRDLVEEVRRKIAKEYPLSYLQFEDILQPLGVDLTILPMVYTPHTPNSHSNRLVLSELTSELMSNRLNSLTHSLLLSKTPHKALEDKIYAFLASVLRLDSDDICEDLMNAKQVRVSLTQLKQMLIDEYVVSSILSRSGLRCQIKTKGKLEDIQSLNKMFWRETQINEHTFELTFQPKVDFYSVKYFNPHYQWLKRHIFSQQQQGFKTTRYPANIIQQKLNVKQNEHYFDSSCFILLTSIEKQQLNCYLSQLQSTPVAPLHPTWEEYQNSPFFHLFHFQTHFFISKYSFKMVHEGISRLIVKKSYAKVTSCIREHLLRTWIWAKNSPNLLMEVQDLASLANMFSGNQIECLQNCLLSLQVGIKTYQNHEVSASVVLEKAFKAASIHRNYHRYSRAFDLLTTAEQVFLQIIQNKFIKDFSNIWNFICLFNNKAELLLILNLLTKAEEYLKATLKVFYRIKEDLSGQFSQKLKDIFEEEFETYSLLFRTFELEDKKAELIHIMEDCSVKYVQNYLQISSLKSQNVDTNPMCLRFRRYLRQTLKCIWIAVVANSYQCKMPTKQPYYNIQYPSLKTIDLESVRKIIIQMVKIKLVNCDFHEEEAPSAVAELIISQMQKYPVEEGVKAEDKPKSILVGLVINCLSQLSLVYSANQGNLSTRSQDLLVLQSIVTFLGFEFTVGSIDSYILNFNCEL